jgi:hypothetical protein
MKSLWNRYNAWRLRRQQLLLTQWPQVRAKGRGRFVVCETFTFMVFLTAFYDVSGQLFDFGTSRSFWEHIAVNTLVGIFIGYSWWDDQENKYKDAQLKPH